MFYCTMNTSTSTTTNNYRLDRSPPQLSPLTSIHNSHRCIAATRDIILNNMLQRKRGWGGAPRRGREGGREGVHVPIIKQLQGIVLHLRFLSKLCFLSKLRIIVLAAPAQPMFPTCHLLYHWCCCLSRFMLPSASWHLFLLSLCSFWYC